MLNIVRRYKKQCIIIGVILCAFLLAAYLRALFLPGMWHGDAFLYRQKDGSFVGTDIYTDYKMTVSRYDNGAEIDFSVNDKTNHYEIKYDNDLNRNVEVLENGTVIFKGKAIGNKNNYILIDNEKGTTDVTIRVGNVPPTLEELFPGYTRLYNWAVSDKTDTRGNPYMLLLILLFAAILFVDIKFPNFFWILEHRLDVDGGEPSAWYRFGQGVGRVVLSIGILVLIVLTFTIH